MPPETQAQPAHPHRSPPHRTALHEEHDCNHVVAGINNPTRKLKAARRPESSHDGRRKKGIDKKTMEELGPRFNGSLHLFPGIFHSTNEKRLPAKRRMVIAQSRFPPPRPRPPRRQQAHQSRFFCRRRRAVAVVAFYFLAFFTLPYPTPRRRRRRPRPGRRRRRRRQFRIAAVERVSVFVARQKSRVASSAFLASFSAIPAPPSSFPLPAGRVFSSFSLQFTPLCIMPYVEPGLFFLCGRAARGPYPEL